MDGITEATDSRVLLQVEAEGVAARPGPAEARHDQGGQARLEGPSARERIIGEHAASPAR